MCWQGFLNFDSVSVNALFIFRSENFVDEMTFKSQYTICKNTCSVVNCIIRMIDKMVFLMPWFGMLWKYGNTQLLIFFVILLLLRR